MNGRASTPVSEGVPERRQTSWLKRVGVAAVMVGTLGLLAGCGASGPSASINAADASVSHGVATSQVTVTNHSGEALPDVTAHLTRHMSDISTIVLVPISTGKTTILVPVTTITPIFSDATGVASPCGVRGGDVVFGTVAPGATKTCSVTYSAADRGAGGGQVSVVTHTTDTQGGVRTGALSQADGSRTAFNEVGMG